MGAGAEGEVRPCAWKRGLKLKWKLGNEEGGPRSSSQQIEIERERERGTLERGNVQTPGRVVSRDQFVFLLSQVHIAECGMWGVGAWHGA